MQIFYNPEIRQLIIVETDKAMSVYLQSDETPTRKAEEIIKAYHADPANVATCEEIIQRGTDDELPIEQGPEKEEPQAPTETTNGDDKTN